MEIVSTGRTDVKFDYKAELNKYPGIEIGNDIQRPKDEEDLISRLMTQDVRDYHEKIGFKIPPDMYACLIVNTKNITFGYKYYGLKMVLENSTDDKLNEQLEEYIDYLACDYKGFKKMDEKCFYAAYAKFGTDEMHLAGFFRNLQEIYPFMKDWNEDYQVIKVRPIQNREEFEKLGDDMDCCVPDGIGSAWYSKEGFLEYVSFYDIPDLYYDNEDSFSCKYFIMPHPFKEYDLIIDTQDGSKGIARNVMTRDEEEAFYEKHKEHLDYSDSLHSFYYDSIRTDLTYDMEFSYDHVNPFQIRYLRKEDWLSEYEEYTYNMLRDVLKGDTFMFNLECQMKYTYRKWVEKENLLAEKEKSKLLESYVMKELDARGVRNQEYHDGRQKDDYIPIDKYEEYLKKTFPEYEAIDIYKYALASEDYDKEDVLEMIIPSKTMRDYHKRFGYTVPERKLITMLEYNSEQDYPFFKELKALEKLRERTESTFIKDYITRRIVCSEYSFKSFAHYDGKSVYSLYTLWNEKKRDIYSNYEENGSFLTFDEALAMGRRTKEKCLIIKTKPYEYYDQIEDYDKAVGKSWMTMHPCIKIDEEGCIIEMRGGEDIPYADIENEFGRSVDDMPYVPNPLRRGDYVEFIDKSYGVKRVGIVSSAIVGRIPEEDDEKDNDIDMITSREYSEYEINVQYLNPDYMEDDIKILKNRIYSWNLEKVEEPPYETDSEAAVLHSICAMIQGYEDMWNVEVTVRDMIEKKKEEEILRFGEDTEE